VVDIEPNLPARRSSHNKPKVPKYSPSDSTVPLPSMVSTPEPSSHDMSTDEWGTGVPYGAFFKSNQNLSIKDDDEDDEEGEDDGNGEEENSDAADSALTSMSRAIDSE
jgi:hypothetical protein